MARKEPFKRISVADRIYAALDKKREEESKDDFRPLPMNAYCEKILWDYARGELSRGESLQAGQSLVKRPALTSLHFESPSQSESEEGLNPKGKKNGGKIPRQDYGK